MTDLTHIVSRQRSSDFRGMRRCLSSGWHRIGAEGTIPRFPRRRCASGNRIAHMNPGAAGRTRQMRSPLSSEASGARPGATDGRPPSQAPPRRTLRPYLASGTVLSPAPWRGPPRGRSWRTWHADSARGRWGWIKPWPIPDHAAFRHPLRVRLTLSVPDPIE